MSGPGRPTHRVATPSARKPVREAHRAGNGTASADTLATLGAYAVIGTVSLVIALAVIGGAYVLLALLYVVAQGM